MCLHVQNVCNIVVVELFVKELIRVTTTIIPFLLQSSLALFRFKGYRCRPVITGTRDISTLSMVWVLQVSIGSSDHLTSGGPSRVGFLPSKDIYKKSMKQQFFSEICLLVIDVNIRRNMFNSGGLRSRPEYEEMVEDFISMYLRPRIVIRG